MVDHEATRENVYIEVTRAALRGQKKMAASVPVGPSPSEGKKHPHMRETIKSRSHIDSNNKDRMYAIVNVRGPHVTYQNKNHKSKAKFLDKTYDHMKDSLEKALTKESIIVYKKVK